MDSSRGILFSYLTLLAIFASEVQCASVPHKKSNEPICVDFPPEASGTPGLGVEKNYWPIVLHSHDPESGIFNYTVIRTGVGQNGKTQCIFTAEASEEPIITAIYQVSDDKIMFVYRSDDVSHFKRIDMKQCTVYNLNYNLAETDSDSEIQAFTISTHNIDILFKTEDNKTVKGTFDHDGKKIGHSKPFALQTDEISDVHLLSPKSSSSNLIVEYQKGDSNFVSLVDSDGKLIKHLMQAKTEVWNDPLYDVRDSSYAYCFDHESKHDHLDCGQLDESGNRKFKNSTHYAENRFALRSLKDGGLILFTADDKKGIHAVEMRPGQVIEKSYPFPTSTTGTYTLSYYNDVDREFAVVTQILSDTNKICAQRFPFPSKSQ